MVVPCASWTLETPLSLRGSPDPPSRRFAEAANIARLALIMGGQPSPRSGSDDPRSTRPVHAPLRLPRKHGDPHLMLGM